MSRPYLPWLKLYSEVCTDPDITAMPLDQQAVYFRLLAYANTQDERGTIPADNLPKLARWVANGQTDTLKATLDYMTDDWGTLELRNGRYYFLQWEKHQRNPSDTPEAIAERKAKHDASYKEDNRANTPENANRTSNNAIELPLRGERKEERDRERVKTEEEDGLVHPIYGLIETEETQDDLVYRRVETSLELFGNVYAQRGLLDTLREFSDEPDPVGEARHWLAKYGGVYQSPGKRQSSYREWLIRCRKDRENAERPHHSTVQTERRPVERKPDYQPTAEDLDYVARAYAVQGLA